MSNNTISLSTSGTVVIAASSVLGPYLRLTGTLTGNVTLDFGPGPGWWLIDTTVLALGGHVLTFGSGSGTATPIAIGNVYSVVTFGGNTISTGGAGGGSFTAGGDLSGSSSSQEVVGLLSHALPSIATGYLNWTGSAWALSALPAGITLTNDLGGTLASPEVVGLLNKALPALPGADQYLHYTGSAWAFTAVAGLTNTVPNGLTGATTFTAHGVLVGNGTSAISSVSPVSSDGLPLIGSSTATPAFGALSLSSTAVTGVLGFANGGAGATGYTDGGVAGVVAIIAGAAAVTIGDTMTIAVPAGANVDVWYSIEFVSVNGTLTTGPVFGITDLVDGSNILLAEAFAPGSVVSGAPLTVRWTTMYRYTGLSTGSHTFNLKCSLASSSGATGSTQKVHIYAQIH